MKSAFEDVAGLRQLRSTHGSLLVGLDFDGTLAPIVPVPDDATLLPAALPVLEALAGRADSAVAFVSGRSLADLRARIAVDGAWFAGNHGLEIDGPGVHRIHPEAEATMPLMARVSRQLAETFAAWRGVILEDKGLSLSVHYRLVEDPAEHRRVEAAVTACAGNVAGIRLTGGKRVVEVRPDVDWNKGRAFAFLRETLEAATGAAPALFIGDDVTDEDAFRVLSPRDLPVYVGARVPDGSAARAVLDSPEDVVEFLRLLAADDVAASWTTTDAAR